MKKCHIRQLATLLLVTFSLSAVAACEVTEKQIIGAWTQITKHGFFEDMAFESDGKNRTFSSWLHQRPEIMGATWSLKDCRLSIDNKDDKRLSFNFAVNVNQKGQLELKEDKDRVASKYKRIQ